MSAQPIRFSAWGSSSRISRRMPGSNWDAMIASLAAGRLLSVPPATRKRSPCPRYHEPMAVIDALEQFFETQPSLSTEEEFVRLVTAQPEAPKP